MTTVLVTRPKAAAKQLANRLIEKNYKPIIFPTIEITSLELKQAEIDENTDIVIFVSPNAVANGVYLLKNPQSKKLKVAAVGESTANALKQQHIAVAIVPKEFNSESLLACTELQHVAGKKIALIKGIGGRSLLAETLMGRGAEVIEINVYRRDLPKQQVSQELLNKVDVITATSVEVLKNLWKLTPDSLKHKLLTKVLLVTSQRIVLAAKDLGFERNVALAKDARTESLIAKLESLEI